MLGVTMLGVSALPAFAATIYLQQDLVSDLPGMAAVTDPNLVNPWGLSSSSTSPWWVSDNGAGVATLYNGNTGVPVALVVTVPPSAPTGQVFNSTASSFVINGGAKANFIFATENGTIDAWNGAQGTTAFQEVNNSGTGAVYKGLALGSTSSGDFLYAANFNAGTVDVFNSTFAPATVSGGFADPTIPAGYAPFNIQNLGGMLYVTYAKQDAAKHDDVAGAGFGFVNVFDTNGKLVKRLASNGVLNSPWGLALAPSNFGTYSNDLLVGNFGDGTINAYDPQSNSFLGTLLNGNGLPLTIDGLWGLAFGNGAAAGPTSSLFFTAGIAGPDAVEDHGLFGSIVATPEPATGGMVWAGIVWGGLSLILRARRRHTAAFFKGI
jgi:uncharacterized protein (TIGR03118 family)